ncbi:efflux RND transporter permease subunit [Rappaport israeli]|uniref:efflux RND transporter permease subunit n=1 Tax=Rappaport israeli TaxID=1839807 RepID=UPI0018EA1A22|nr:efflux RND transporter permease subunit [Rappaport israeli]
MGFEITRSRGASEVAVMERVDALLDRLAAQNPQLQFEKVFDLATPVKQDYHASIQMLIEGGILAVVVVFAFLRNVRATFVAATALPLSIIPAFIGIYWLGFSINAISLLALSLVIGVLVDDAIVEIENIMRHLRLGKTPYQAAMEAADEIGLAVVATTFTLIAVFLPTAFMSGVIGQFFKQFGWTASIAIFASLLVARLLTPMMSAYLLKPDRSVEPEKGRLMRGYLKLVRWTIRWRWLTLGVTLALFIGSLSLGRYLSTAFIPADDFSQSRVQIELPPESTLEDTQQVSEWARAAIAEIDGIEHVYTSIGGAHADLEKDSGGSGEVRKATLNLVLAERGTRALKTIIERQITKALENVPGARFSVGLSNGGEQNYKIALTSNYPQALKQTTRQLIDELRTLPNASNVRSDEGLVREELKIYLII